MVNFNNLRDDILNKSCDSADLYGEVILIEDLYRILDKYEIRENNRKNIK